MKYIRGLSYYANGRWFMLPVDFLNVLPWNAAILLAWILNHVYMNFGGRDDEDWVLMTNQQVNKVLTVERQTLVRLLTWLTRARFIKTKRKGIPPRRWVKVNLRAIERKIPLKISNETSLSHPVQVNETTMSHTDETTMSRSSYKKKKKRNLGAAPQLPEVSLLMARQLGDGVIAGRKVSYPNGKVPSFTKQHGAWSKEFKKLLNDHKETHLQEVLDWYCKMLRQHGVHLGATERIPEAWSGGTFRERFARIESAKAKRDKEEGVDEGPKLKIKHIVRKEKLRQSQLGW